MTAKRSAKDSVCHWYSHAQSIVVSVRRQILYASIVTTAMIAPPLQYISPRKAPASLQSGLLQVPGDSNHLEPLSCMRIYR